MIAYKGFEKGLICRGYRFSASEVNVCEKANCAANGFHCAENPFDVLIYYPNTENSEYWIVTAGGDINEDGNDSKISCTELALLAPITKEDLVWEGLIYIARHPKRISKEYSINRGGIKVECGEAPKVKGSIGDVLGLAVRKDGEIVKIAAAAVDGERIKADTYYTAEELEKAAAAGE